jgi:hypothetical protein
MWCKKNYKTFKNLVVSKIAIICVYHGMGENWTIHWLKRTTKSTRFKPTSLKSSNKPEALRLKVGRNVSDSEHMKWGCPCDALPSPLLDPSWVQRSHIVQLFGIWGTFLASSTKRGRGAYWSSGIRLGRRTSFI